METKISWTIELTRQEAEKYKSRSEFQKNSKKAYFAALRHGWLDEVCKHMVIKRKNWTIDELRKVAIKYNELISFQKKENAAYLYALRHGLLDEIVSHMKRNTRWSIEKLQNEALKYNSKTEFEKNSTNAYNSALRRGVIDEITKHMKPLGNKFKRLIYVFEFPDKHFYVGLTYDLNKRHYNHLRDYRSSVSKHITITGQQPILKIITDYIDKEIAIEKENDVLIDYIEKGWKPLNKVKTGSLGGNLRIWNKKKILDIVKKYDKLIDFRKSEPKAWEAAIRLKCYQEVIKNLEKKIKVRKYTDDILKSLISNYNKLSDFRKSEPSAYNSLLRNNKHYLLSNLERIEYYWINFENVYEEAKKYKTKKEFINNSPGAFLSSKKNNWYNEVTKHMTQKFVWSKKLVKEITEKYDDYNEFRANNKGAYDAAHKYGWLEELTSHMKKKRFWNHDSVRIEALKYKNRDAFRVNSGGAFCYAKKNNILDDVTSHMELKNISGHKKDIFVCDTCGKKIGGKGNLTKHKKSAHGTNTL